MQKTILTVVGTRPNFIKITQLDKAFSKYPQIKHVLVHTGQHFDDNMSKVFFDQLKIRTPDLYLNIEEREPAKQIGHIIIELTKAIEIYQPDLLLVVGDVNSTMAAAIAANKKGVKLAHLESGLRSFDKSMPEEHNRVITDAISDCFFITEQSGYDHLLSEGHSAEKLLFVGNTMIDTLAAFDADIQRNTIVEELGLKAKQFVLMTMHRPANVDVKEELEKLLHLINFISVDYDVVFPIHPRTMQKIKAYGFEALISENKRIRFLPPLDYLAFQKLVADCKFVVTDSGGIQEETTYRQIPCLTLRPNTERPSTVLLGTNTLLPFDVSLLEENINAIKSGNYKTGNIPPLWDGKASERIVDSIVTKIL